MSADGWAKCPRCMAHAEARRDLRLEALREAYGKVDIAEYQRLQGEARELEEMGDTLREDFVQGVQENGMYGCDYHAQCQACDWEFSFRHEAKAFEKF